MTGLAGWLTLQVDTDEKAAGKPRAWKVAHHDCAEPQWDPCTESPCPHAAECAEGKCWHCAVRGSDGMIIYDEGGHTQADAAHIAPWDPARALAEVAFKRRLIAAYRSATEDFTHVDENARRVALEEACHAMAEVFKDRAGYQEAVS